LCREEGPGKEEGHEEGPGVAGRRPCAEKKAPEKKKGMRRDPA